MRTSSFVAALRRQGYDDVALTGFPSGHQLNGHEHPYDLRGLVTEGEFVIGVGGEETSYRSGDVFELDRNVAHVERVGPEGVTFLIGRRHPVPHDDVDDDSA